jgi:hypothetical protein
VNQSSFPLITFLSTLMFLAHHFWKVRAATDQIPSALTEIWAPAKLFSPPMISSCAQVKLCLFDGDEFLSTREDRDGQR